MKDNKITLESTLKSIETENWLDRKFYRPIGFQIALLLRNTGITPNMVTVFSIFVGIAGGISFYFPTLKMNLLGVLLMIFANILDCVDGQLARLTGIKSKVGRIIDGFAGDLWFAAIYISIALRLMNFGWEGWVFIFVLLSGYSHSRQAAIADYYKTLHLLFISKTKGSEFDNYENLQNLWKNTKWSDGWIYKFFLFFYRFYTVGQEKATPKLQKLLSIINEKFDGNIPDEIRSDFRAKSKSLMPIIDWLTFNGRTPVLFILTIVGSLFDDSFLVYIPFGYYIFEIFILNPIMFLAIKKHETLCGDFKEKLKK